MLVLLIALAGVAPAADLSVSTDFPGGAAEVVSIDQAERLITFKVPKQKNGGWMSWWYFKVSGITPGEMIQLHLTNGQTHAGRAVYSTDGKAWKFTDVVPPDQRKKPAFYRATVDAAEAHFAWYVPYLPGDVKALADEAAKKPFVKVFELCRSEEGLSVPGMTIAEGEAKDRPGVWVHARQHAWEVGSSWAMHGLATWLISDDERARRLRRSAEITLIPMVDVDSVQGGRGGKDQKPYDHNRDWIENPRWNAIKAALPRVKAMDQAGRLDLFLDLHDPGWGGGIEFWCHTYKTMGEVRRHNTDLFLAAAKAEMTGPMRFDGRALVKYALTTPTSGIWGTTKTREKVVGGTFEIGVAPPKGFDAPPPEHHLRWGEQLGRAIEGYVSGGGRREK